MSTSSNSTSLNTTSANSTTLNTTSFNITNANDAISNATLSEIETRLMTILINNEDKLLYGQYLYNLLLDRYGYKGGFIDPSFKNKFFIIMRNIDSNENIKVIKNNDIYKAVYTTKPELYTNSTIGIEDKDKLTEVVYQQLEYKTSEIYKFIELSMPDKLPEVRTYIDENGNTIYHDLVKECAVDILRNMFTCKMMDINVKNKNDQTPIDYINDIVVARLFIKEINEQLKVVLKQVETINKEKYEMQIKLASCQKQLNSIINIFWTVVLVLAGVISFSMKLYSISHIFWTAGLVCVISFFMKYIFKLYI